MSSRRTSRIATHRLAVIIGLASIAGLAACADATTAPARDGAATGAIEAITPRLDGGDTTSARGCDHSQGWDC